MTFSSTPDAILSTDFYDSMHYLPYEQRDEHGFMKMETYDFEMRMYDDDGHLDDPFIQIKQNFISSIHTQSTPQQVSCYLIDKIMEIKTTFSMEVIFLALLLVILLHDHMVAMEMATNSRGK